MKWIPNEKQAIALTMRNVREVFYGGARGGGKTDFLIADFLNGVNEWGEHWNGILFRQSYSQLEEVIRRAKQIYVPLGADYRKAENSFVFPNGAQINFRYLESDEDCENYQGHSYTWIGFDELGNYRTPYPWDMMSMCNRSARVPGEWLRMRGTGNPGGVGHKWLKERFVAGRTPYQTYQIEAGIDEYNSQLYISRAFVPAAVNDNRALLRSNPNYKAALMAQPEHIRMAMLEGRWDIKSGGEFFSELDSTKHVIEPRILQGEWKRYCAFDWGFKSPFALVKLAVNHDGKAIVYGEWYGQGTVDGKEKENIGIQLPSRDAAARIAQMMAEEGVTEIICDNSMWNERSSAPKDIDPFYDYGMVCIKSIKNRLEGWGIIRELLTDEDGYGQPYLQIFSSCRYLLREMESIQCDKNSIEIADSRMADHAIDALRYGLNSDLYRRREAKNTAPVRAYKKQREPYDPTKRGCWAGGGAG